MFSSLARRALRPKHTAPRRPASDPPKRILADADGRPLARRNIVLIIVLIAFGYALAAVHILGPPAAGKAVVMLGHVAVAFSTGVYAIADIITATRSFRAGRTLPGLLWTALAVMMLLIAVASVASMMGPTP